MASSEILQEYLVKLGFQTDAVSFKKFGETLSGTSAKLFNVGTATTALVGSIAAATTAYALGMRNTYFASKLAGSSVRDMQALQFAAEQVGISGGSMESALKGAGALMRDMPLKSMFEGLTGISTAGKESGDIMLSFMEEMKKREKESPIFHRIGATWAQQFFGLSEEDYTALLRNLDNLKNKRREMADMPWALTDEQTQAMVDYDNTLKGLTTHMDRLEGAMAARFAPTLRGVADTLHDGMSYWEGWAAGAYSLTDALEGMVTSTGWLQEFNNRLGSLVGMAKLGDWMAGQSESAWTTQGKAEKKASLPEGKLTAEQTMQYLQKKGVSKEAAAGIAANIQAESGYNPSAVGDSGQAYGLAQWHPDRQAEFKRQMGKDIRKSTAQEQLDFLLYEMQQGKEQEAGGKVLGARSASEAGYMTARYFERPADPYQYSVRARMAAQLGVTAGNAGKGDVHINQTINVAGNATPEAVKGMKNGLDIAAQDIKNTTRNQLGSQVS